MPFRIADVFRNNIVTVPELVSDGYGPNSIYLSANLISTAGGIVTVDLTPANDVSLLYEGDFQVNPGDILFLYQTQPGGIADGYYTVSNILSDNTLSTVESLPNSIDGYIQFRYTVGASIVGFNPIGTTNIDATNVQEALKELDSAIDGPAGGDLSGTYPDPTVAKIQGNPIQPGILGAAQDGYVLTWVNPDGEWEPQPAPSSSTGLTPLEHAQLRQLIHLADGVGGPFEGFLTGSYRTVTGSLLTPTYICWWTSVAQVAKIVDKIITYNGVLQPTVIVWSVYASDGVTVLASVTDTITYNVIFETSRTRTVIDYTGGCNTCVITAQTHETLRQLIHLADGVGGPFEEFASGAYRETLYPVGEPFQSQVTWYTDNSKLYKIVEHSIVRNTINMPTAITWKVYDVDGVTVLSTVTDNIVYVNNIFETSRTRTIT